MHQFTYNGHSSVEYRMLVNSKGTFSMPERALERVEVPGRNGDILVDGGRWHNVTVRYKVGIPRGFQDHWRDARSLMLSEPGYHRLEDTFHPEEYRMAVLTGGIEPEIFGAHRRAGNLEIVFSCKPQRYLKSGERPLTLQEPGTVLNEWMESLPLITVSGSGEGTLTVGDVEVELLDIDGHITLDCDVMDAYKGNENRNDRIATERFPVLAHGRNDITWSGGVTGLVITPRWLRL